MFAFQLQYKKVKHISLRIKQDGDIVVSAPLGLDKQYVDDFVRSKSEWIKRNMALLEKRQKQSKQYINDNQKLFLGELYHCDYNVQMNLLYHFDHEKKALHLSQHKKALKQCYQETAETVFSDVLSEMLLKIVPYYQKTPELQLRQMTRRWGTCYAQENRIIINTKLIQAPQSLIELVILHELIHFIHPHHQKPFYDLFDQLMPDRKEREKRLADYAFILDVKI